MRLDINLASQPYADARQFWMRWGTGLVAVAIFTLLLLVSTITGWYNARRDRAQMAELRHQIERKSFSWTQVFEDLEKIMPARVHLVSIHPELGEDNQLAVKMVVAGESPQRGIDLAQRMEASGRFAQTHIAHVTTGQSQTPGDAATLN